MYFDVIAQRSRSPQHFATNTARKILMIWSIIDIAIIDIARCKIITFIVYRYSDNVSRKICTMEWVKWFRNSSESNVFIQLFLFCKKIAFSMTFEAFYDVRTLFMFYDNKWCVSLVINWKHSEILWNNIILLKGIWTSLLCLRSQCFRVYWMMITEQIAVRGFNRIR